MTIVGHDRRVAPSSSAVPPSGTQATIGQKVAASVATVAAAAGLMGLATFGRFDAQHDTTTTSVLAPYPGPPSR